MGNVGSMSSTIYRLDLWSAEGPLWRCARHDVIGYRMTNGSPVYVCVIDAKGAFDAIPHAIFFFKSSGLCFHRVLKITCTLVQPATSIRQVGVSN